MKYKRERYAIARLPRGAAHIADGIRTALLGDESR
jgi:hypothetical protein